MKPPKDADIIETPTSTSWLDEEGFICSNSKKSSLNIEASRKSLEIFLQKYGNRKYCFLVDVTNASHGNREQRELVTKEILKIANAIAFISNSVFGRMIGNLFISLTSLPCPAKFFENEEEARMWLRQY